MSIVVPFISTLADPLWRISHLYKIKDKEKQTVVMKPNRLQLHILAEIAKLKQQSDKRIMLVILKPRQIGCTTFFCVRYLDKAYWSRNQFAAVIAHIREKAMEIFHEIVKFAYDNIDEPIKFKAKNDSVNQLGWRKISSQVKVTSDGHGITPNMLHLTEVARMKNAYEMIGEALQGVPRSGEIVLESTAFGKGGFFYDVCQDAQDNPDSGWHFIFLKWWHHLEYCLPVPKGFIRTAQEEEFIKLYGDDDLCDGNFVFRREKIQELLANKTDDETGLSGEMLFRQNYPFTPEEAFITSAISIFNVEILESMRSRAKDPVDKTQWGHGWLRSYNGADNAKEYLISVDTASGEASNYAAATILNRSTGEIIAVLQGKYVPHELARYVDKLGRFFNNAIVAVERNNHGHAVLEALIHTFSYPNLYHHRDYDRQGKSRALVGFPTHQKTRSIIISDLEKAINEGQYLPDKKLIEECLNFGMKNGKAQAIHGHDDLVLAYAIGNHLCNQPNSMVVPPGGLQKPEGM